MASGQQFPRNPLGRCSLRLSLSFAPEALLNCDIVSTSLRDICLADPTRAQENHVGLRNLTSRLEAEMLGTALWYYTGTGIVMILA
jgi:hypothetical protein